MTQPFEIHPDPPGGAARAFLSTDLPWNIFALADLAPPYAEHARLTVALDADERIVASCLIYDFPGDRSLVTFGSAEGIRTILGSVELPDETNLVARERDLPVVTEFFEPIGEFRTIQRMSLTRGDFTPGAISPSFTTGLIGAGEYAEVDLLYERWGGITTGLFPDGQVFGARDAEGRLCAVAVAMACNGIEGIGTVGAVFTHPDRRGRGLGKAVTATACQHWFDLGRNEIYLNVQSENAPARSAYRALGFKDRLTYRVLPGRRRS